MIIHVDMDEFFAAVEKLDNPELRGKCLLVGGASRDRGVVSTASYEARKFGCRSAMPMARAVKLCPKAIVLPVRGERYRQVSQQIFEIFHRFTPLVEPLSIDEAFLDVTGSVRLLGPPEQIAKSIKKAIRDEVGITASVGIAENKFLAKLASDMDKPDGLTVIPPDKVQEILDPLKVEKLWGVGKAMADSLHRLNIHTVKQLRLCDVNLLSSRLGKAGSQLHRLSQGIDERQVVCDHQAKSIGQEQTFAKNISDKQTLRDTMFDQTQQVSRRLRAAQMFARTVTVKIRYSDFTTLTRSFTFDQPTDVTDEIWGAVVELFNAWAAEHFRAVRLIGVTISHLSATRHAQLGLFENKTNDKLRTVDQTMDEITEKFGTDAIRKGSKPQKNDSDS